MIPREKIFAFMEKQDYELIEESVKSLKFELRYPPNEPSTTRVYFFIYPDGKEISKIIKYKGQDVWGKFTNEELRFFDALGFRIYGFNALHTDQEINDWFHKGQDGENPFDIVNKGLQKLGYDEAIRKPSDYGWRWYHKTDGTIIFYFNGDHWKGTTIYNTFEKEREGGYVIKFSNAELKLLDSLGFQLAPVYTETHAEVDESVQQDVSDWFHKGQDDIDSRKQVIIKYFKALGWHIEDLTLLDVDARSADEADLELEKVDNREHITIHIYLGEYFDQEYANTIYKTRKKLSGLDQLESFTKSELRFFDSLGFKLSPGVEKHSGQSIGDWWTSKALDSIKDLKQVVLDKFLAEGWEEEDQTKNRKDVFSLVKDLDGFEAELIRGYITVAKGVKHLDMTVVKAVVTTYDNNSKVVKLTYDELRFFDGLGFTINPRATNITEQVIEDWWSGKAHDGMSITQIILQYAKDKKYKLVPDTPSSPLLRFLVNKHNEPRHRHETLLVFNMNEKTVLKEKLTYAKEPKINPAFHRLVDDQILEFTNEELRFFDNIGFEVDEVAMERNGQSVNDWWYNKANDSIDMSALIQNFYEKSGYEKSNMFTDKDVDLYIKKGTDKESRIWIYYSKNEIEKNLKVFGKSGAVETNVVDLFTYDELRFFDGLGFELTEHQKEWTNQTMNDWFYRIDYKNLEARIRVFYDSNYSKVEYRKSSRYEIDNLIIQYYLDKEKFTVAVDFNFQNVEKTNDYRFFKLDDKEFDFFKKSGLHTAKNFGLWTGQKF